MARAGSFIIPILRWETGGLTYLITQVTGMVDTLMHSASLTTELSLKPKQTSPKQPASYMALLCGSVSFPLK